MSRRYDKNRSRQIRRHRYKIYLSIMLVVCIKQHLSNIWSSIHEKVNQNWGWVEKKCCLEKACISTSRKTYCVDFLICYETKREFDFAPS